MGSSSIVRHQFCLAASLVTHCHSATGAIILCSPGVTSSTKHGAPWLSARWMAGPISIGVPSIRIDSVSGFGILADSRMKKTTDKDLVRISKCLSLVLRHRPGRIGLKLDEGGWADVDELLAALPSVGAEWRKSFACAYGAPALPPKGTGEGARPFSCSLPAKGGVGGLQ